MYRAPCAVLKLINPPTEPGRQSGLLEDTRTTTRLSLLKCRAAQCSKPNTHVVVPASRAFGPYLGFVQKTMCPVCKLIPCLHLITRATHANYDSPLTTSALRIRRETKRALLFRDPTGFFGVAVETDPLFSAPLGLCGSCETCSSVKPHSASCESCQVTVKPHSASAQSLQVTAKSHSAAARSLRGCTVQSLMINVSFHISYAYRASAALELIAIYDGIGGGSWVNVCNKSRKMAGASLNGHRVKPLAQCLG